MLTRIATMKRGKLPHIITSLLRTLLLSGMKSYIFLTKLEYGLPKNARLTLSRDYWKSVGRVLKMQRSRLEDEIVALK